METIEEERLDVALLLLFSVERQLTGQKVYEAMHDGLVGYYTDPFVLIKIQSFLSERGIKEKLVTLLKTI